MIPERIIEQVIDRNSIVDVITDYGIQLKRHGRSKYYECCCPFHGEKTPSFKVDDIKGTYRCFGCGESGNAISFVMKHDGLEFPAAVKVLADKKNIKIEEREETDDEKNSRLEREANLGLMGRVDALYKAMFREDADAQEYAHGRWGAEYCEEEGIGYAPKGNVLVSWAEKNGESLDRLRTLSLVGIDEHNCWYDFFRARIMIPIKDRMGRVISYTARDMTGTSKSKYLNGAESPIYRKGDVLFGFHNARRIASKEQKVYAVEGAPDCMRLQQIGVVNTVAPLGTAWTEAQFHLLKRIVHKICFLPDADPAKDGDEFGAGVKAVIKNGKEAMKAGFAVSVKPIPLGKQGEKQDPDEYCRDIKRFNGLEERDFIIWLAELRFERANTTEAKATVVAELAGLIAMVQSDTEQAMLIDELAEMSKKKENLWRSAVNDQKRIANEKAGQPKKQKEIEIEQLSQYGFYIKKGKYCSTTKDGDEWEWSNFTMEPLFHIIDNIMPKRLYYIKNEFGLKRLVELRQEELVGLSKFKQKVEGLGNFIWMASDREFTKLKRFLYEVTETAEEIKQLGWQRAGFFAFGNGVWDDGEFQTVDDMGIVRLGELGNYYLPAFSQQYKKDNKLYKFEKTFVHMGYSTIPLAQFTSQIFRVFGDNGRIGFCFLLATLFRDIVTAETRSFPILNLFGPKGSGKSELGHTLMSFFIAGNVPPNLQNATLPALNDTVAAVANALVHIDEFKNDIDLYKREFLKGLWDGTGRTRMNMDLDKKKETTSVDAGIILSGQEMATADIALFSRFVYLTFDTSEFTKEQQAEYNRLKEMRSLGVSHLTLQLLRHRKKMEVEFKDFYRMTQSEMDAALEGERIEDRIRNNWTILLAVLRTLESSLAIDIHYESMKPVIIDGIKRQNAECKSNNELAGFWRTVKYLLSEGEIVNEGDFCIKTVTSLTTDIVTNADWPESKRVLFLQKSRIFKLYKRSNKMTDEVGIPEASLKYYLEKSKEYLGEKKSVRFKCFLKGGIPKMSTPKFPGDKSRHVEEVQRAYCFDYDELVKNYQINLLDTSQAEQETSPDLFDRME